MARVTISTAEDGSLQKQCSRCRAVKPITEYNKNRNTVQSHCKPCRGAYRSERRKLFPEQFRARDKRGNLRRYGLKEADWEALFDSQGRRCSICQTDTPSGRNWHTDHDHDTGRVRGILCHHCNMAVGYYELVIAKHEARLRSYLRKD
jgi:hypothetical protein